MRRLLFCAYLCVNAVALSQETEQMAENPLIRSAASPKVVFVECKEALPLEGITLVDASVPIDGVKEEPGIHIKLDHPSEYFGLKTQLQELLNHPINEETIDRVKRTIEDYFLQEKGQYVAPIIPEQDVTDGIMVVQILSGRVGEVNFVGQKWFEKRLLEKCVQLKHGDPIIERKLLDDLAWLNRHPFHRTQMILAPGIDPGATDIEFITQDRFPARFFVGADNTGYKPNKQARLFAGFNWGNAFRTGDLLSYQYTAAPNLHSFQAHVVNYTSFLNSKKILTLFGCYGTVYPNISGFNSSGIGAQGSIRFQAPILPLYGDFRHEIEMGFDYKYTNSNLFFLGDPAEIAGDFLGPHSIVVTQFMGAYSLMRNWTQHAFNFKVEAFASVWRNWIFPHQKTVDYAALRPQSHVRYFYSRINMGDQYRTDKKWTMLWNVQGQVANDALPTSEQFGLGGADTVRGYFEQQFVADNAFLLNLELYTPVIPLFNQQPNEASFLLFLDYGYGHNYKATSPEFFSQHLLGIGAGFRYDVIPYVNLKIDWGFQLAPIPGDNEIGRIHLSAYANY